MKKYFFIIIILIISDFSWGTDFGRGVGRRSRYLICPGGHFTYNTTFLMNKNILDVGDTQNTELSFGYNVGADFEVIFDISIFYPAIEFEYSAVSQLYTNSAGSFNSRVDLSLFNVPVLLKIKAGENGYIEIGPQFSILNSGKYNLTWNTDPLSIKNSIFQIGDVEGADVKEQFVKKYVSAVFGFGSYFNLYQEALILKVGARASYSFTDAQGIDAYGRNIQAVFVENSAVHKGTHIFYGGLTLGLTYRFY